MKPSLIHAAVVHFPIALLICGSLAMLGYLHRWPRAELRILGWGLLLPGWLTVLAAIVSGIVAQGGLPPDAPFRPILNWHTGSGSGPGRSLCGVALPRLAALDAGQEGGTGRILSAGRYSGPTQREMAPDPAASPGNRAGRPQRMARRTSRLFLRRGRALKGNAYYIFCPAQRVRSPYDNDSCRG